MEADGNPALAGRTGSACPHCGFVLLWSEDRGAHCDGCDEFDPERDLPPNAAVSDGGTPFAPRPGSKGNV